MLPLDADGSAGAAAGEAEGAVHGKGIAGEVDERAAGRHVGPHQQIGHRLAVRVQRHAPKCGVPVDGRARDGEAAKLDSGIARSPL